MKFFVSNAAVLLLHGTVFGKAFTSSSSSSSIRSAPLLSTASASIHAPVGLDGEGAYTASTKGCFDVIDAASPLVLESVSSMPLPTSRAFHVADYGTADGGTSLGLLSSVVRTLRQREGHLKREVLLRYEDQPANEWKSVFAHASGARRVTDAYGRPVVPPTDLGDVYVEGCGTGFHERCYPSNSVDLGLSFTAMHWLSAFPNSLKGTEWMHSARVQVQEGASDSSVAESERLQASEDWDAILEARAAELTQGGRFVCVNFCVSEEGYFLGQTDKGASMWDSFQKSWDTLKHQNLISEEERLGVSFPNYYRTTNEFKKGIDKCDGLRLISADERVVRCPYREQYVNGGKDDMSPQEYARGFVPTTRSWSHSTFKGALNNDRTEQEKEHVMARFWKNYEELVAEDPESHGMDYVHSYLVIEKV